jgi:hypothetical protein
MGGKVRQAPRGLQTHIIYPNMAPQTLLAEHGARTGRSYGHKPVHAKARFRSPAITGTVMALPITCPIALQG